MPKWLLGEWEGGRVGDAEFPASCCAKMAMVVLTHVSLILADLNPILVHLGTMSADRDTSWPILALYQPNLDPSWPMLAPILAFCLPNIG